MKRSKTIILFTLLVLLVVVLFVADLFIGSVALNSKAMFLTILGEDTNPLISNLLYNFRLPKATMAILAGAALSAAGLQMQTLFRNPLAGPYVLGVSAGASLGVSMFLLGIPLLGSVAIAEPLRNLGVVGAAWIGSSAILLIVMAAATRIKDIMAILILGMMIGSAATAIVEILQYLSPEYALKSFVVWSMGSLGSVAKDQLWFVALFTIIGLLISILLIKPLNLMLLGENYARTMGQNIRMTHVLIFISTILLTGTITAFCGPIGFIGIAVPHISRMIFANADHKILMPASMLVGAVVMLFCDIVAQLPGYETVLPINTVTALVGIPIVVIVIIRNKRVF